MRSWRKSLGIRVVVWGDLGSREEGFGYLGFWGKDADFDLVEICLFRKVRIKIIDLVLEVGCEAIGL